MNVKPSENVLVVTDRNAYNIGELGIGTNSKARITDAVLKDEKVLSTVHIVLGDNTPTVGGHTKSRIHLDGNRFQPTVWVDKRQLLKTGTLDLTV